MDETRRFLKFLRPDGGLLVLTTLLHLPETITVKLPDEIDEALTWLSKQNANKRNCYYQHQFVRKRHEDRISKADVESIQFLHLDFDWKDGNFKLKAFPDMIENKAAEFRTLERPPSAIVCSGNGVQALWKLKEPVSVELAERANLAILKELGGDPGTYDGARLLRLPGFTNWPRQHYLEPAQAYLIEAHPDRAYEIEAFPLAEIKAVRKTVGVLAEAVEVDEEALAKLNLPAPLVDIIKTGQCSDGKHAPSDQSRSGWCMYGVTWLAGLRIPDGVILGVLSNELWCIGDSLRDAKGRSFEEGARRILERAKAYVAASLEEVFSAPFEAKELDFSVPIRDENLDFSL